MTFCIWLLLWLLTCLKSYWFIFLNFPSLLSHSPAYEVSISGNTVELTCPRESEGEIQWKKNDEQMKGYTGKQLLLNNFSEMDNSGYYQCYTTEGNKEAAHTLYLKARGNTVFRASSTRLFREDILKVHSQDFPLPNLQFPGSFVLLLHSIQDYLGPHIISVF